MFQCDNGTEFKNRELKIFLENEGIDLIFSRVRHPETNGCVEAIHKIVRKNLLRDYHIKKAKFNIEISLTKFILFYNNTLNNVTKRIPSDIKDVDEPDEIAEINRNIIKSMSRKLNTGSNVDKDDFLLLNSKIKLEKNVIILKNKYKKNNYIIPCRFISFINSNLVRIIIDVNYNSLLEKDKVYNCEVLLLNVVDDFAYNYFLKNFNFCLDNNDSKESSSSAND